MNEISKRIITATFCILISLIFIKWNMYTMIIFYTTLAIAGMYEYHYKLESTRKKITILLSTIIHMIILGYIFDFIDSKYTSLSLPICMCLFSIELFYGEKNPILSIGTDLIGIVWISIPMILSILLSYPHNVHNSDIMICIMTLVFSNDTGAYFFGRAFGRYKLYPAISPKKTWEGAIGGALISLGVYFVIRNYYLFLSYTNWTVILCICIICGTIGDLIESMFKRDLNIKDTGSILPGHGGVLDRIDGLLYAVPFVYSYLTIIEKV